MSIENHAQALIAQGAGGLALGARLRAVLGQLHRLATATDLPSPLRGRWPERSGRLDGGRPEGTNPLDPARPPPPTPPRKGEGSAPGFILNAMQRLGTGSPPHSLSRVGEGRGEGRTSPNMAPPSPCSSPTRERGPVLDAACGSIVRSGSGSLAALAIPSQTQNPSRPSR